MANLKPDQTAHFSLAVPFHSSIGEANFNVDVYEAKPAGPTRGLIIVIQEIFGANDHIRSVARGYAEKGFTAWAPSFFDAVEGGVELGYDAEGFAKGRELVGKLGWDKPLAVLAAAAARWEKDHKGKPVATIGFCWGGALAYLCSTRLKGAGIHANVAYYGSQIYQFRHETVQIPLIMHFGEKDTFITKDKTDAVREEHPEVPLYVYPAGHGFNRDVSHDYDKASADLAWQRTDVFLREHGF
jgi:carboxymethylenebutenolidase